MSPREEICAARVALVETGLNRGTSGNISLRDGTHMLITPSGIPPRDISPEEVARKLRLVEIYNRRLDERDRRKAFVLERGLVNVRRQQVRRGARPSPSFLCVSLCL